MVNVQKINNDLESSRLQRNMTKTQKKNSNNVKEGKIVNAFVKDPNLSLDETLDTLVISQESVELPEKVFEQEIPRNHGIYYLAGASVGAMGLLGGFTYLMKNFAEKKCNSTKEYLLPGITRNHCINDEVHQSIFSMIQSPNRKTILAAVGVITLGAMAFVAKNFIDGVKDVWVRSQEADIQKNLQENLIAVETQSFSGKMQIIRNMLSAKAKILADSLSSNQNFRGSKISEEKRDSENKSSYLITAGVTLLSLLGLGYYSLKNIRKSENYIKKGVKNTQEGLNNIINDFNNNVKIKPIINHNGEKLSDKEAYKYVIENLLESIYAKPQEVEELIEKMNMSKIEKKEFVKHINDSMNQATEKVNSAIGGSGRNKITYFSHVNDYLSFFYDWLMNPNNPQFKNLFIGISGVSALAYGGKTLTEAVRDVQVKKYQAEIELDLQKRLVSTELRNFKAKKEAAIEPLCNEFLVQKQNGKSPTELKIMADNILFEIKNGPPFVYS